MSANHHQPHPARVASREEAAENTLIDSVAVIVVLALVVALIAVLGSF